MQPGTVLRFQLSVVDETRWIWLQAPRRHFSGKCSSFHITMTAKPGCHTVKIAVVITRMTAEFERPLSGQCTQNFVEGCRIQMACGGDSKRSVRRKNASVVDLLL